MKKKLVLILFCFVFLMVLKKAAGSPALTQTLAYCSSDTNIPVSVLQIAYYPPDPDNPEYLDDEETGWQSQKISEMRIATQEMVEAGLETVSESTRYHGYKDPDSPIFLHYYILESKEFYEPIPRGHPLGGITYRPNYREILRDLNICDYIDNQGVKEIWMYGYHSTVIVPDESRMSSKYGDISNSYPKEQYVSSEYRMPICNNSYVLYNFTYKPNARIGNNLHNRLHQIENVVFYSENRGYPANPNNVDNSLFWDDFSEYVQSYTVRDYLSSCGNTHLGPNWTNQDTDGYRYDLRNYRENNCETWHPDDSLTTYVNANCEQWGCTDIGFYQWFMQNIPGFNNGTDYQGQKMRNWWEAMYDFNAFIDKGKSLYGESIFPDCTPTPTPTPDIQLSSEYYGTVMSCGAVDPVIPIPAWNYGPSIMLDDDGRYKMWWCGGDLNEGDMLVDHIWYTTSDDGFNWENPQVVLGSTGGQEGVHTCDPSVVKAENTYYLYYTSDSPSVHAKDNQIFLATSTDGIHWNKYPSNDNPQPVIACENPNGSYCAGQSSVLYKDGKFLHYFSDTTGASGSNWYVYLASSSDGINFVRENNGKAVAGGSYGQNSVDVKYSPALRLYFMVHGEVNDDRIYWNASFDGINWLPYDDSRVIEVGAKERNHNPGILGSSSGMIENEVIAYYGAGGSSGLGTWNLDATTISLNPFTIQGYKLNCPNGTKILLDGVEETTDQPYFFHDVSGGISHTVSLQLPAGSPSYNIFHSPCDCCIDHSGDSFINGDSHTFTKITVCEGDYNYYDLYWRCSLDVKGLLFKYGTSDSDFDFNSDDLVNGIDFGIMVKLIL